MAIEIIELLRDDIISLSAFGSAWIKICSGGSMTHNFSLGSGAVKRSWSSTKNYECLSTGGFGVRKTYTLEKWDGVHPVKVTAKISATWFKFGLVINSVFGSIQNKVNREYTTEIMPNVNSQIEIKLLTNLVKDSKTGHFLIDWIKFEQEIEVPDPIPEPGPGEPTEEGLSFDTKVGIFVGIVAVVIGTILGLKLASKQKK